MKKYGYYCQHPVSGIYATRPIVYDSGPYSEHILDGHWMLKYYVPLFFKKLDLI